MRSSQSIEKHVAHTGISAAILALTFIVLAGCSPTPVPDDDQAPDSGVTEKMHSDAADCRKQTRTVAGVNPTAWYDRAYSDCMAGRGYKSDAGQTNKVRPQGL